MITNISTINMSEKAERYAKGFVDSRTASQDDSWQRQARVVAVNPVLDSHNEARPPAVPQV